MNSYRKLCTEFYDLDKPHAPEHDLNFYRSYVEKANGPILEPMCGSGRFLMPFLAEGYDIDGTDASPEMLEACRKHCQDKGLTPTLYQQFLHETQLPRQYALVFIPTGSFSLIPEPEQARESLQRLYNHMLTGGRLVLEVQRVMSDCSFSWPWGGRWITRPDGARILLSWLGHYDAEERVTHDMGRYELISDGRLLETEFEETNIRHYHLDEFRSLLMEAGLEDVKILKAHEFCARMMKIQV
jgi:hypothetical protein